jgi:hypothetical protein
MHTSMNDLKPLLSSLILNERKLQYEFKRATNLSKIDIEVIAFANKYRAFNAYQLRKYYNITNGQQLLKTLEKLTKMNIISFVGVQSRSKSKQYLFNFNGERFLKDYSSMLERYI